MGQEGYRGPSGGILEPSHQGWQEQMCGSGGPEGHVPVIQLEHVGESGGASRVAGARNSGG